MRVLPLIALSAAAALSLSACNTTSGYASGYGGRGYDHLLTGVPGILLGMGLPVGVIPKLLVENPRRLLAGDPGR